MQRRLTVQCGFDFSSMQPSFHSKTNGGTMLTFNDLNIICKQDWGMKAGIVGGKNLTWDFIYQILAAYSLIYMAYPISDKLAHAVVLYGVGGLDSGSYTVNMMDPLYGYRESSLTVFQDAAGAVVHEELVSVAVRV